MGKIFKENGIIWLEEIQSIQPSHKKLIMLGKYDEVDDNEKIVKPTKRKRKKEDNN